MQTAIISQQVVTLPRLKSRRLRAALSQRDLAARSGVAASTIVRIEKGHETHPLTTRRLAEALQCDPSELMAEA